MTHTKEKRTRKWILGIMMAVLVVGACVGARIISPMLRLLDAVNVPRSFIFSVKDRAYWEDWLNYVAGYEIIAAEIPPEKWHIPDGWTEQAVTLEELQTICDIRINDSELYDLKTGELPEIWDSWFFREDEKLSECWIGLYSETGTLIIYRGLELWVAGGYWDRYE